jgi:hypothetical protein
MRSSGVQGLAGFTADLPAALPAQARISLAVGS